MKQLPLTLAAGAMLALFGCSNGDAGKDTPATIKDTLIKEISDAVKEEPPMDSAAMAKAWEEYMTPGDMHKWMASSNGKWDAEITSWMEEDKPPMTSKSGVENKSIMGGRYQESIYNGNMMGMPFEGRSLLGYDNSKKIFVNTWIDNMGTGIMFMEGTYDEASKTIHLAGKMTDIGGKDLDVRQTYKLVDDKHHHMEMFCTKNGKESKMMAIQLTKK